MRNTATPGFELWAVGKCLLAGLLLAALATGPAARADSLWDKRTRTAAFLYTDNVAAEIGDLLTVLIADQSSFIVKGEREAEKVTEQSGEFSIDTTLVDVSWPASTATQKSSRKFESESEYTGSRRLLDRITVTVVDKLPNGNMVIAGRSERVISGEKVVTVLTGIVKGEDVAGDNSVSSQRVAHLRIYYETSGSTEAYLKDGLLNRIMNVVWPF